ncbi:MAG: molybdate ABC transporter substrate-binding protein [Solobacterium sp.]|nr:molybdate ABC transporter substrate-binding protein [Solobacterium sp.]
MKKIFAFLSAFAMVIALAGCGSSAASEGSGSASASPTDEQVELIVFAAASMTETLEEIQKTYEAENPNVRLIFTFDSSGTLKTQIAEAAPCDVFISAAPKQMNQLDITQDEEKNPDRLDFIDPDTRINLLENKVALVVPSNNPLDIKNFDDLAEKLKNEQILMAMGNSDVPVGQYTQKILAYYELNEEELANAGKITYGTNVKDVVEQVKNESVQAGVVYATDAASGGLTVIDTAKKEMCGQVIYPAAVLKESAHPEEAKAFLAYLQSDAAMKVFEGVGFSKAE